MKTLVIVAVALVAFVAANEEWKPIVDDATNTKFFKICIEQSELTKEKLERFVNAKHLDEKEVREYVLCHTKKLGLFTEDSGYNTDRVIAYFNALGTVTEEEETTIRECVKKSDPNSTPAVRAFRGMVCVCGDDIDKIYNKVG